MKDVAKTIKKHLNEISRKTVKSAYDKATQLSNNPNLTKYERIYRKNQASNFKNYLTKLDKEDVPNRNILKDIYKAELGDIIVYKYIDWGALNLLSISPEIYKENKKILTEYIPIGMCINTDNEITIMANTTIIAESDRYRQIDINVTRFKVKQYRSDNHHWKPATLQDFEYIQKNYDIIKNAIKLTNICKAFVGNVNGYTGIDKKETYSSFGNFTYIHFPHYIFKTNKIEWLGLNHYEALRPMLHIEYKK